MHQTKFTIYTVKKSPATVNILTLVRDQWLIVSDKMIFLSLAGMDKVKLWRNINIYLQEQVYFHPNKLNFVSLVQIDKLV